MANQDQVDRLLAGVGGWNQWREENPNVNIDLEKAYLRAAYLVQANFSRANLNGADLSSTHLEGTYFNRADLIAANLSGAHLDDADLNEAKLRKAEFTGAHLKGTNLSGTDLVWALLLETDLREANFKNANLGGTVLGCLDLREVKGLDKVKHHGPSQISADTLQHSEGRIPQEFLRGCGLSNWEIESVKLYQPGLNTDQVTDITYKICELRAGNPIQYQSVFISYSSQEQDFAQRLYDDLQNSGVRCWFAPKDIQGGRKLHEQIDYAIQRNDRTLLILSENSMNSEWVKTEIANTRKKEAKEKRQILFPIRLVDFAKIQAWECFDADMGKDSAREIRAYFIPDFSHWQDQQAYMSAFERLLKDLRSTEENE